MGREYAQRGQVDSRTDIAEVPFALDGELAIEDELSWRGEWASERSDGGTFMYGGANPSTV